MAIHAIAPTIEHIIVHAIEHTIEDSNEHTIAYTLEYTNEHICYIATIFYWYIALLIVQ